MYSPRPPPCGSRFVAPVVTRFILDIGGRNTYAAVQFLVCGLSSMMVLRTVLLFKQKSLADRTDAKPDAQKYS